VDDEKLKQEFPGNSYTDIKQKKVPETSSSAPAKKSDKGRVKEKRKSIGERIAESFLATDKEEIREHLLFDWIVPGIKTVIEDIVHMILYGDASRGDGRIRRDRGDSKLRKIPYNSIYDDPRRRDDAYIAQRGSRRPELIFDRKSDAEQVLSGMCEYIDDYGKITMKEFYNLVSEVTDGDIDIPTSYTQTRYGWYDVSNVSVVHVREGYLLRLPKAEVIDR